MIETRRLMLTAAAPQHLLILIERPEAFEQSTGLSVAPGLREFYVSGEVSPAWLSALRKSSDPDPWRHGFFIVHREENSVIGTAGFKGRKTTMARSKSRMASRPEPNASTRVLLKNGFRHCGMVVDPEDGPVWRWELNRTS